MVVIAILGVLAFSNGPTAIADLANTKGTFLEKLLDLPRGVPSNDVFRRVLMALNALSFQECLVHWLTTLRNAVMAAAGLDKACLGQIKGVSPEWHCRRVSARRIALD